MSVDDCGECGRLQDLVLVLEADLAELAPLKSKNPEMLELRKELEIAQRSARQWEREWQMAERNNDDRKAEVAWLREKLKAANKRAGDAAETLGWNRMATNLAGAEVVRLRAVVDSLAHHVRELEMIRSNLLPEELDRP